MAKNALRAADEAVEPAILPPDPLRVQHLALTMIAVAIVILLLQVMSSVLIPFVFSALLFYALDPAVDWMERRRLPRAIGAALMIVVVISAVGGLAYTLQGQALAIVDQLPTGARKLAADTLQATKDSAGSSPGVMRVQIENPGFQARTFVWASSIGLMLALNQLVMVLFLTYFMLLSDQLFKRKLVEIVDSFSKKKLTVRVLEDIAGQIEQFLLIQIVTSLAVALATWGALRLLGLQQAALWGLLAGIFNSIPYYGPLLVTAGLSIVGFLQFGQVGMTAMVAGVALLITTLEGSLLTPMMLGRASSMNKVAIFAGLLFWSWIWGVWGMLLAVPMMMVVKVICDHVDALQPVSHLLGD
jgi:predicted PurR-regulated permease PerM